MFFHYFHLAPLILYNFAPIITLISSIFTIIRMVQSREMLLLQSMSISNTRIMLPFLSFACIISISMVFLQEFVIPNFSEEIIENNKIRKGRKTRSSFQYKDRSGKIFYIDEVDPIAKKISNIRISIFNESDYKVIKVIEAQEGTWAEDHHEEVLLKYGVIFDYEQNKLDYISEEGIKIKTEMNIYRLIAPSKDFDILSTHELITMAENSNNIEIVIALYSKLTIPLSNIFILLMCMPIILDTSISNFLARIGICIVITSCFYGFNLTFLSLGKKEILTPMFASFFPYYC